MDISLTIIGVMALLKPLLEKASGKAAETIGEKFAEKVLEKKFWKKIKDLFITPGDFKIIEQIENKPIATPDEIKLIQDRFTKAVSVNEELASEILSAFNLSTTDMFIAEELLKSIQADREALANYYEEKRRAGVATEGDYQNIIARTQRNLERDEEKFIKLIKKKSKLNI